MVPARLGKGQGAKEIGHNLARVRPKFGHNLVPERQQIGHGLEREWFTARTTTFVRERPIFGHNPACERNEIWAQCCGRSMKTWAQICKHRTVHQLSENTKTEMICENKNCLFSIRAGRNVNRAGCTGVRAGRKTVGAGRSALGNTPSWNTVGGFRSLLPVLQKMVKLGTPKQAKHAIRCIDSLVPNKSAIYQQIFEVSSRRRKNCPFRRCAVFRLHGELVLVSSC